MKNRKKIEKRIKCFSSLFFENNNNNNNNHSYRAKEAKLNSK